MKKILSLFLAFVLCFSLGAPALAAEPETFTDGAFLYEKLNDTEVMLSGLSGAAPTSGLSIPERASDGSAVYTVTAIKKFAFFRTGVAGGLSLPGTLTRIGEYAFADCDGLTGDLILPDSVTQIEESAFDGCAGITSVTLPASLRSIGPFAFSGCRSLSGTVDLPATVTEVGNFAFTDCPGLEALRFTGVSVPAIGYTIVDGAEKVYFRGSARDAYLSALTGRVGEADLVALYAISVSTSLEHGALSFVGDSLVEAGQTISVTAQPSSGYLTAEVTYNGTSMTPISGTDYEFIMPEADVTLSAVFSPSSDAQPPVIAAVSPDQSVKAGADVTLSVTATSPDGGTLSYQWYQSADVSGANGTEIPGATASAYQPSTAAPGVFYYYCVVTNTNDTAAGQKTATTTSRVITLTVAEPVVDAQPPVITGTSPDQSVDEGSSVRLSVTATSPDGGVLSYQWYRSADASGANGTEIDGATASTYQPSTAVTGAFYYYCIVTNTHEDALGQKSAAVTSRVITLTVNEVIVDAAPPVLTAISPNQSVSKGTTLRLSVTATSPDGGVLSYQWYRSADASGANGTEIDGATASTYQPSTAATGAFYYYCVITNTNDQVNGAHTASLTTSVITVTVSESSGGGGGGGGTTKVDAAPPVIESFSLDQTVEQNAETTLSVVARSTDGGTLSYQWYRSETEGSTGGEQIEGATAPSYAPPTDIAGAYTYYCVVTNTNPKATGSKTASTTTPAVTVTVLEHSEDCNGGPDCPSYHFTDVDAGMWHHLYVDYVVSHQLMNGISETSFAPDSTLTRAMLAQILYNAEGAPASDRSADFGDVDSDAWYYKAIAFVSSEGLMGGYGDGQFGPDDFITREQLVTTLYRYAEKTGKPVTAAGDLTGFPDGASVSSWAQRAMEWAIGAELIFGRDDGTLDPTGTATRAEIAAVLMRYFTAA